MRQVVLSISALFFSLTLLIVGNGMLGTLLAIRLELEHFQTWIAGLVLALYSIGFVLGSLYGVRVVNRVGHIRSFASFAAVATAAVLVHPLHISIFGWMVLRLIVGFCIAGLMLVTESWVNARATSKSRGPMFAIYMILFFLAAASGQFLLALGDPAQHHLFSVAAILVALSLVPISVTRSPAPELHEGEFLGVIGLLKKAELGLGGAFLSGVVVSAFGAIGPMYALRLGLEADRVGLFMGVTVLTAMAFQWPVGLLSDYLPRVLVILGIAAGGLGASLAAALLGSTSMVALFVTAALFVGTTSSLYAVSLALTHDVLDHTQIVPASATLLLASGLGTIVGPIGGAVAMAWLGPKGLFFFTAAVLTLLVLLASHAYFRQPAPPVEEQTHCVGVAPVSTPVLSELDPRNEDFEPVAVGVGESLPDEESDTIQSNSSDQPET